jgi:aspartyl/asparaginyl beta-hydroxylase (cupin superfamily)
MSEIPPDLQSLYAQASAALKARDLAASLALFAKLCASPGATAQMHFSHALARLAAKDVDGMLSALERVLDREPSNPRALILKADALAQRGDSSAAAVFYAAALRAAPPNPPPVLSRDLDRAHAFVAQASRTYEEFLRRRLSENGYVPGRSSPRFAEALEMLLGHKDRALNSQRPRMFFMPGLDEIGFFPPDATPWMPALEAQTSAIRTELHAILRTAQGFSPYIERDPRLPPGQQKTMEGNEDWSAYYFWKFGAENSQNTRACPNTAAALRAAPLCDMPARGPMALFSWLKPGARIPPHTGMLNTRMICHLPLIVPPGCGFRVGTETREWREGVGWAFDDSFDHEAWNKSDRLRVILIFDVWRPDVTPEERHLINTMFAAIDEYAGRPPEWEI